MDGRIEQLHYTWAPRGAEGINRFQIAALSAGLKKGAMASLLPVLRKICRYDRPKGEADELPVSFGWFDHREHRIAFCRVGLPRGSGRRGSFAAHVVVATPDAMPEAEIASSFGAPFWWTGLTAAELEGISEKRDFELPAVSLDDLVGERLAPVPTDLPAALALAHGILTLPPGQRLAVVDRDGRFGPALRALARRFPQALEGLSLSTYEGAPTFPFKVVGAPVPQPRMRACDLSSPDSLDPEVRSLLMLLLGEGDEAERLRSALRGLSARDSEAPLWESAGRLIEVATGQRGAGDATAQLLADPDAVALAARRDGGRATLVEVLARGAPQVIEALRLALPRVPPGAIEALCGALSKRYASSGQLAGCHRVVKVLPDGPARSAMLDQVLAAACADESAARSLGAEDAALIVGIAAARSHRAGTESPLLRGAARHVGACAIGGEVPTAHLTAMFRVAMAGDEGDAGLAEALRLRPSLLVRAELSPEERERCLALAQRLDPERLADALPALLPVLAEPSRRNSLLDLLARLPSAVAARCTIAAMGIAETEDAIPPVLAEIAEDRAVVALGKELGPLAVGLLEHVPSDDAQLACELLRSLVRRSGEPAARLARRAGGIRGDRLRSAVLDAALGRAIAEVVHPDDVEAIWLELIDAYPGTSAEELLDRLLALGARSSGVVGAAALLAWVAAVLLPSRPKLCGRAGRLRSRVGEDRAHAIAEGAAEWAMDQMDRYVKERGDRRTVSWWGDLVRHNRRIAKRG